MRNRLENKHAIRTYGIITTAITEVLLNPWFKIPRNRRVRTDYLNRLQKSLTELEIYVEFGEPNSVEIELYKLAKKVDGYISIQLTASERRKVRQKAPGYDIPYQVYMNLPKGDLGLCEVEDLLNQLDKAVCKVKDYRELSLDEVRELVSCREGLMWAAHRIINFYNRGTQLGY